jgi:hypothetical protein
MVLHVVPVHHLMVLVQVHPVEVVPFVLVFPVQRRQRLMIHVVDAGVLFLVTLVHIAVRRPVAAVHITALAFVSGVHGLALGGVSRFETTGSPFRFAFFGLAAHAGRRFRLGAGLGLFDLFLVATPAAVIKFAARHQNTPYSRLLRECE